MRALMSVETAIAPMARTDRVTYDVPGTDLKRMAPQAGFEPATLRLTEPCHRVGRCGSALFAEGFVTGDAVGAGEDRCGLGHHVSPCLTFQTNPPCFVTKNILSGTRSC